ncbi:putative E3 ubiquitin-protein ligase RNF216 [Podospora australis]|uniref:E3 ubiquitin-protein ligase RNF216 n=1 Tax=Podospora australis TaxID=1536484 RepID=A0AAN6WVQ6_9PEZI|nr:putative E3 ubiquitin-protein ligase RNF216 [Podospora australis]
MGLTNLISSSSSTANRTAKVAAAKKEIPPATAADGAGTSTALSQYIAEDAQIQPADAEPPDLRELNACLDALAAVFPDVQIEVFRELLTNFDGESRLALAADALLKNHATWVKGRWRVAKEGEGQRPPSPPTVDAGFPPIPKREAFRSPEYKAAVQALAWQEFKGLSRSAVNAVLAESNYAYLEARETLVELSTKSWRYTISSFFRGKKVISAAEAAHHPLVIYKSTGQGSIVPTIKTTGNAELDMELFRSLIKPLRRKHKQEVEAKDRQLAMDLNNAEAEETENLFECSCCYTESTWEEIVSCSAEGHLVCFRCVQHTLTEAVFGQGFQRTVDKATGTLCCPAATGSECKGIISSDQLHRAMMAEAGGAEKLLKLDQRLVDNSLAAIGLPLIHCPFCPYAEIDDIYLPASASHTPVQQHKLYNLITLGVVFIIFFYSWPIPFILLTTTLTLILQTTPKISSLIDSEFRAALQRHHRRRRGLRFTCRNESCLKQSCLSCNKAWVDMHICHESSLVALRTQVEQAMSMAIKRVCPKCNTSFVKSQGCNKLVCVCGYKMCYVCRKDIGPSRSNEAGGEEGYQHFCNHFRAVLGGCTQCNKCNLWESEDTEAVLQKAKEEAEQKWRATEDRNLTGAEMTYIATGLSASGIGGLERRGAGEGLLGRLMSERRLPRVEEVADLGVEYFYLY